MRRLAMELFDSVETLIRIDMSEYMEKHSVSKLIGLRPDMLAMTMRASSLKKYAESRTV